ncbi:unnamed protein product [Colias eurytheme]|nr:unnamed protein product [Colias eurytheme]
MRRFCLLITLVFCSIVRTHQLTINMVYKLIIFSALFMSAMCSFLHPAPIPIFLETYQEPPKPYDFSYEVNDPHTGDVKSQQESKRGDTVLGQYSVIQPDGIRRTVDYQANDLTGFLATVNNQRPQVNQHQEQYQEESTRPTTASSGSNDGQASQGWPSPSSTPPTISFSSVLHPYQNNLWL